MIDHRLAAEFGLNAAQAEAATVVDRHLCVEAGAGSGKTRVLVARLAGLLEPGQCALDEIVAITFTRKAASEMRERLRKVFRQRARVPGVSPEEQSHWRELIRRLETARINTIDGFCASLLREHAVRLGIDPEFTVLDESETVLFREETVRAELMQMLEANHAGARRFAEEFGVDELVQSVLALVRQSRAVQLATAPLPMDDADALFELRREQADGAGTEAIARFVEDGDLETLCRYLESLDGTCSDASDKLERYRAGFLDSIRLLLNAPTRADAAEAIAKLCSFNRGHGSSKNWDPAVFDELKNRLGTLNGLAKEIAFPEFDARLERRAAQLAVDLYSTYDRVHKAYQAAKRRRYAMDFGDLLDETVSALQRDHGLRARLRSTFKHILIDEFQDTDPMQFELVSLLRGSDDEPGAFLFIVGDVKQSIYRFRGADVEVFEQAQASLTDTVRLAQNYRSDPEILAFVNAFYETSGKLSSAAREYQPLEPNRAPNAGRVKFLIPEEDPDTPSAGEYRRREATLITRRLLALCNGDAHVCDPATNEYRPAQFGDAAILFRKSTAIPIYEQVLREHGVPFVIEQGRGYFDRQEIHDVVNLLKFIANPWDEVALVGFLRSPLAALSDESLMELTAKGRLAQMFYGTVSLADADQHARLVRARELVRECRAMRQAPVPELLECIYERTGFEAAQLALHHAVQRASNVRKLLDNAESVSASRTPDLHAFIRFVSEVHAYDLVESEAPWVDYESGAVTLMTVHKAKGLEFPIVVLADTGRTMARGNNTRPLVVNRRYGVACKVEDDDGARAQPVVFDLAAQDESRRELAEEARILYVGMTRARDHLLIAGAPRPTKNSWLAWFDETFAVTARSDGDEVPAGEANARIVRTHASGRIDGPTAETGTCDAAALVEQVQPLALDVRAGGSIGVDQILDLVQGEHDSEPDVRAPGAAMDPRLRGRVVHRVFEEWNGAPPDLDRIVEEFELSEANSSTMRAELEQCCERFAASPLHERYSDGEAIRKELPFMVSLDDRVVSGVIDAFLPDGTIVDYKTGSNTPEKLARYSKQLQLYAFALRAIDSGLVSGAIVYFTDSGEAVDVDVSTAAVDAAVSEARQALAIRKRAG